ncbi:hypothetical protein DB41_KD00050 [Neochlamydia sp. TUME1]|nr:hypothetical protein DB41_KD00050 [Neochlamydia sp. TUME1]
MLYGLSLLYSASSALANSKSKCFFSFYKNFLVECFDFTYNHSLSLSIRLPKILPS